VFRVKTTIQIRNGICGSTAHLSCTTLKSVPWNNKVVKKANATPKVIGLILSLK